MPESGIIFHTFNHPWVVMTIANWRKYPNPSRPDLVSVDIIDKFVDPKTNVLHIKRLFIIKGLGYPDWLRKILGQNHGYFVEETTVDLKEKKLVMKNENISFANILKLEETCTYVPDEKNPENATLFKQEAVVTAFPYLINGIIERFAAQKFRDNAHHGQKVMEEAVEKVRKEFLEVEELTRSKLRNQWSSLKSTFEQAEKAAKEKFENVEKEIERKYVEVEKEIEHVASKKVSEVDTHGWWKYVQAFVGWE